MKLRSVYSLLLIFIFSNALFFLSCKKDMKNEEPIVTNPPNTNAYAIPAAAPVNGSLSGLVVNENNVPQAGAEVKCGTATTQTDSRGLFHFTNIALDKYISTVTVTVNGYFKAYRSFSANATRNYVSIKLIQKVLSGTINSSPGGTLQLADGTSLSFQPNSIIDKSTGAAYTGDVNVYATYIDPTAADIATRVPGSFMGKDASNIYSLRSTGMIAVEMESSGGQSLQLAAGRPAMINMPIPASLTTNAPTTIDTWSLDDQGVWKKEGTATRSGSHYEMPVSHFSFWNCDIADNGIFLNMHIQDQEGNALSNLNIRLQSTGSNYWGSAYSFTDSLGNASGLVPAGIQFQFNLLTNQYDCSTSLYSDLIGPFTSNTSLNITASLSASTALTVTGTATNCNSTSLQNGTAFIYADQYNYAVATVVNGTYTAVIPHCSAINTINVTVADNDNQQQATSAAIAVSGNSVTVPSITACGNTQSAVYTFGNGGGNCQLTAVGGDYIPGIALTANNTVSLAVNVVTIGTYQVSTSFENGISFTAFGIFTTTGQQSVILTGEGTPVIATTSYFMVQAAGAPMCSFALSSGAQGPAAWNFLNTGCPELYASGDYISGIPLNVADSLTLWVEVITTGTYDINTGAPVNGISFSATGTFNATGFQQVTFMGSGTPVTEGATRLILQNGTAVIGCDFIVNVFPPGTPAHFLMGDGSGQGCASVSLYGVYNAGYPLDPTLGRAGIWVNVSSPGTYSISTNFMNGFLFSGTGTFSTTGYQYIELHAYGTPAVINVFTYRQQSNNNRGCDFTVQTN